MPEVPAPLVDEECVAEPSVGSFDPVIEWQWAKNTLTPGYDMVMMTPVVGDIDLDGMPDVVFTSYVGGSYSSVGPLNAIRGDDGSMIWSITEAGGHSWGGSGGVAIGDLEGDGVPEICVAGATASVVCVDGATGAFRWAAGSQTYTYGCPAIADLDGDGLAEVILGSQIFGYDGTLLGSGAHGVGMYGMSFAADVDGDGVQEVIAGNAVYTGDGSTLWTDGLADGIPAIADFDGDGAPEVVRSGGGVVTLSRASNGETLWQVSVPGGGGGPPTVADFDGDGMVEVGVAGLSYYTLFDGDGSILWSNPTEDDSSSVTGSSVFDFEGDGAAEVVYADEHSLYIYDGASGAILLQHEGHASGTLFEYPIVADVDADGATEIIIGSNDMWWEGWGGITVIGDRKNSWAPARKVWNQHAYNITNVNGDGSIPADPEENWTRWNSFRAGGTELGPSHWLPDVSVQDVALCLERCAAGVVEVQVSVQNDGLVESGETTLAVGSQREAVASIPAGGGAVLGVFEVSEEDWGDSLAVTIDPDDALSECDESNNVTDLGAWPCDSP